MFHRIIPPLSNRHDVIPNYKKKLNDIIINRTYPIEKSDRRSKLQPIYIIDTESLIRETIFVLSRYLLHLQWLTFKRSLIFFKERCSVKAGALSNQSSVKNLTQNFIGFNFLERSQHANHLVELHLVGNFGLVVFVEPGEVNYWWYLQIGICNGKPVINYIRGVQPGWRHRRIWSTHGWTRKTKMVATWKKRNCK